MLLNSLSFILLLEVASVINNECGCSVDRSKDGNLDTYSKSFFCSETSEESCSLRKEINKNFAVETMIKVSSGEYQFGTDEIVTESDREGPMRIVELQSFYLDKYEISNRDFLKFVEDTNYNTEAEVFGDSFVFTLFLNNTVKEDLKDFRVMQAPWWYKVTGANWRHPYGPDSDLEGAMDYPVIHVSWRDAQAYCKWRDARLPTEAEWEAACRGGKRGTKYPWGNKLFPDKKYMANIWQGSFPNHNSEKDGFIGTSPVNQFLQNDFGFYNMAGNVWEWVEDSWALDAPQEKTKKGGSYLCHRSYCYRYRCSARSHNTEDSSAGNLGFRCAKSV